MNVVEVKNVRIGEGMTKICVPMVAPTEYDVDMQIRTIKKSKTDLVEFRADCFEDCLDMDVLIKILEKIQDELAEFPIVFTFRTRSEGGSHDITPDQYREMLLRVVENELVDLIDVEYFYDIPFVTEVIEAAHDHGIKVVVSNHDFKTTIPMEQIVGRFKEMIDTGADIAKIAMMPEDGSQVVDMMQRNCRSMGIRHRLSLSLWVSLAYQPEQPEKCMATASHLQLRVFLLHRARSMWKHFAVSLR